MIKDVISRAFLTVVLFLSPIAGGWAQTKSTSDEQPAKATAAQASPAAKAPAIAIKGRAAKTPVAAATPAITPAETGDSSESAEKNEEGDQPVGVANSEEAGEIRCREIRRWRKKKEDAVTIGENREIASGEIVRGDAVVVGGNLTLNGAVTGDAICIGGQLIMGPEAVVCGDLVNVGGIAEVNPKAFVRGQKVNINGPFGLNSVLRHLGGHRVERNHVKAWGLGERLVRLVGEIVALLFMLFLGFLMTVFMPRQMGRIEEHLVDDFPRSALMGVAMLVLIPIVTLVLVFTCVGILFVPVIALAVAVSAILGYLAFSSVLGQRLLGERPEIVQILTGLTLLMSASVLGALIALPGGAFAAVGAVLSGLGKVIFLGAATIGLGATIQSRWGGRTVAESLAARTRNGASASKI